MKSLDSALRVLMAFSGDRQSFGVSELSEQLAMPKSQVSKILATLRRHGLVTQNAASRRYSVGLRAYALGARFVMHDQLTRECLPVLHAIVAETGHSARLSVQDGDEVIYLIGVEGPHFMDSGWRAGTWLPWHGSSAGRILLAYLPAEEVERLLAAKPLAQVTAHTVTDMAELKRIVDRARDRGYDSQRSEMTVGVGTIAVPIFGPQQRPIGALSIAFPVHEVRPEEDERFAIVLHKRARQVSLRMGSLVYAAGANLENRAV